MNIEEKIKQKSIKAYNSKANNYDNTFDCKFTEKFKKILLNWVKLNKNTILLDVACGNGELLRRFLEKENIQAYGVDISESMVENAKIRCPKGNFKESSCENLVFDSEFFNALTVCAAYHHFPNVNMFASETYRVLKKDGYIYIAEIYMPNFIRKLLNPLVKFSKEGDVKIYSTKDIITTFENAGFTHKQTTVTGWVQLITLQKK